MNVDIMFLSEFYSLKLNIELPQSPREHPVVAPSFVKLKVPESTLHFNI